MRKEGSRQSLPSPLKWYHTTYATPTLVPISLCGQSWTFQGKWINCLKELNNKLIWQGQLKLLLLLKNILAKIYLTLNTPWRICLAENRTLIVNGILAQRPAEIKKEFREENSPNQWQLRAVSRSVWPSVYTRTFQIKRADIYFKQLVTFSPLSLSIFPGIFVWLHSIYRFETNLTQCCVPSHQKCWSLYIYLAIFYIIQHIWFILVTFIPLFIIYNNY